MGSGMCLAHFGSRKSVLDDIPIGSKPACVPPPIKGRLCIPRIVLVCLKRTIIDWHSVADQEGIRRYASHWHAEYPVCQFCR